ncbi:hypothetical protein ZIOFF_035185 [Zingiber officinale]|uniref:Kinesin motor domain-containing protein n=1 Tax=Zingiber officinale TaxID=94328 RepID=A0A8J5G9G3_ZINOF|nr:hypothetical protein ZIOFF_035185 [Zingiber officinale]
MPSATPADGDVVHAKDTQQLASPMRKVVVSMRGYLEEIGHLTKLDPQDTWLPITESRNDNAYYSAFHTLTSGIGFQALILSVAFTYLSYMLEVYNEKIRDLLADSPNQLSKRLDIKQASDGTQDVPGLLEPQVGSIDDVWEILTNGGRNRSVGSTNANELSSRSHSTIDGGYSLEALTSDPKIMSQGNSDDDVELISGKMSMKSIFGGIQGTMYDFYEKCWRPFGVLLVKMESEGILVDKVHLSKIEKLAVGDKQIVADKFRQWASKYCEDAKYMNVGSNTQIRQLLFDDTSRRGRNEMNFESKPLSKLFKVLNTEKIFEEGKKAPLKYRTIHLHMIYEGLQTDMYTASGFLSLSVDALKVFAGNIPSNQIYRINNACNDEYVTEEGIMDDHKLSDTGTDYEDCSYGTAFEAFGGGNKGREACEAIATLCETSAIDSLITNFIIPL